MMSNYVPLRAHSPVGFPFPSATTLSSLIPLDLSRANLVFALRLVVSVLAATSIAFWLQVQDPQWAALTACLVLQPTAGAVVSKSAFRILGTIVGALFGLFALSLYAEAPAPFVGLMVLWLGLAAYCGARARNFTAYGFMLAGYSALLVGFEGMASPGGAWTIAIDRSAEILIGIGCSTAVTLALLPVYAGAILRGSMRQTFAGLADYAAEALDAGTPLATFTATRSQMISNVAKFDTLRSYAAFEAPELRAEQGALRHVVRDFLGVLAVARSLYFRLSELDQQGTGQAFQYVKHLLEDVAASLRAVSTASSSAADSQRIQHDLLATRRKVREAQDTLTSLADGTSFHELADTLLILNLTNEMVQRLAMVMVAETAASQRRTRPARRHEKPEPALGMTEAVLQAARAGLALLLVTLFWVATGWSAGFPPCRELQSWSSS